MFKKIILFFVISSAFANGIFFEKVKEIQIKGGHVSKATLLSDGTVVYFWEQTRSPTEEEKRLRAEWFDKEWEKFKKEAEEKGIPRIEQSSKEMQRELEEWIEKQKTRQPLIVTMKPFFSAAARVIPLLAREAMRIGYPLARRHFINQPVVIRAGLALHYADGREKDIQVDLEKLYGEESWMRVPIEEVILRASPNGDFLIFETLDNFVLFKLKDGTILPVAQLSGYSPFGWSLSGKFMFISKSKGKYVIINMDSLKEIAHFELSSCLALSKDESQIIKAYAISDEMFAIGGWYTFCIYNFSTGEIKHIDTKTFRRIGAIRGLAFSEDGKLLYITSWRGFFIIDPYNFSILYEYIRPALSDFDTDMLLGVSPDGRYAAILHGRERLHGWATLIIWDIYNRRVVQRIGDKEGRMLESISSGFRYISPPAAITKDWRFLLALRQDGVLELYQRK